MDDLAGLAFGQAAPNPSTKTSSIPVNMTAMPVQNFGPRINDNLSKLGNTMPPNAASTPSTNSSFQTQPRAQQSTTLFTSPSVGGTITTPKKDDAFGNLVNFETRAGQTQTSKLSLAEQQQQQMRLKQQQQQQSTGLNAFGPSFPHTAPTSTATTAPTTNSAYPQASQIAKMNTSPAQASSGLDTFGSLLAGTSLAKTNASNSNANVPLNQLKPQSATAPNSAVVSAQITPTSSSNFTSSPVNKVNTQPAAALAKQDQWNFDALVTSNTNKPTTQLANSSSSTSPVFSGGMDQDLFSGFTSATPQQPQVSSTMAASNALPVDDPLGLFGSNIKPLTASIASTSATTSPQQKSTSAPSNEFQSTSFGAHSAAAEEFATPTHKPPKETARAEAPASLKKQEVTETGSDFDKSVARMVEIGFSDDDARNALALHQNQFDLAVEYLLHGGQQMNKKGGSNSTTIAGRLSKLGLSSKNAEKAGKLLNTAGEMGLNIFNRAKVIVADQSRKFTETNERRAGGRKSGSNESVDSDGGNGGYQQWVSREEEDEDSFQREQTSRNVGANSSFTDKRTATSLVNNGFMQSSSEQVAKTKPAEPPVVLPSKKRRPVPRVTASTDQTSQAEKLKEQGNEIFKRGQYGDAEEVYSRAIACLPSGHLQLISLFNNRAAARLKTGNYKECVNDCNDVEAMCKAELDYDDTSPEEIAEYRDAIAKALLRRGTAYENMEKWNEACVDYKQTLLLNPTAKGASDGFRRCTKALQQKDEILGSTISPDAPASKAAPTQSIMEDFTQFDPFASAPTKSSTPINDLSSFVSSPAAPSSNAASAPLSTDHADPNESERVAVLREKEQLQIKEDAEKLVLKDSVDAKLNAWRNGKKDNLRALLSSLDTILWAEMKKDWKPVNLSELITPQQVKIRYMKAISKLHPDKLSNMALSVEQKLLANAIFATLNDGWDAFKTQNNL